MVRWKGLNGEKKVYKSGGDQNSSKLTSTQKKEVKERMRNKWSRNVTLDIYFSLTNTLIHHHWICGTSFWEGENIFASPRAREWIKKIRLICLTSWWIHICRSTTQSCKWLLIWLVLKLIIEINEKVYQRLCFI